MTCSTLIETHDNKKSDPFHIPASVHAKSTQIHREQKEIMEKLDQILEHQVVILSQLQVRRKTDAVENPTFNKIAPTQLPELIPTPAITATNINPVVHDAMLAGTLRLKPKSSSAGNLAAKSVKIIFTPDELINRNCSGSRGKEKLDEEKLKKLTNYVQYVKLMAY